MADAFDLPFLGNICGGVVSHSEAIEVVGHFGFAFLRGHGWGVASLSGVTAAAAALPLPFLGDVDGEVALLLELETIVTLALPFLGNIGGGVALLSETTVVMTALALAFLEGVERGGLSASEWVAQQER